MANYSVQSEEDKDEEFNRTKECFAAFINKKSRFTKRFTKSIDASLLDKKDLGMMKNKVEDQLVKYDQKNSSKTKEFIKQVLKLHPLPNL